jgi:hypothetical protein
MELVYIEWLDHVAFGASEWRNVDELKTLTPIVVMSVGFVAEEDEDSVLLVSHLADNNTGFGEILIIKKTIVNRKKITF